MSTTQANSSNKRGGLKRWGWVLALPLVVGLAVLAAAWTRGGGPGNKAKVAAVFPVKSGPLTIAVTAAGSIRNSDAVILRNEVEGQATVVFLIEEGKVVKEGDLLVEIDSSQLEDTKVDQEIKVKSDEAAFINAQETLKITEKEGESDIQVAQVSLELAILDLEKYVGVGVRELLGIPVSEGGNDLTAIAEKLAEVDASKLDLSSYEATAGGEYSQELKKAENEVTIVKAELERAKTKHDGSVKLREKGYISATELEADRLDFDRKVLELEVVQKDLELLKKYTKQRKVAELLSEVDQKAFALVKARHKATSDVVDAKAMLTAKQLTFDREQSKLDKLVKQIGKCKIVAPQDGMVIHGTSGGGDFRMEPLKEGAQIFPRQELIRMPMAGGMLADVKVYESMIEKVREGLPVEITTDAMPDKRFYGVVKKVAMVPDSQNRWLSPDTKVYNTEVEVQGDLSMLKPGMSCTTKIVVEEYPQTLYVPVQSVLRVNDRPTVYVRTGVGKEEARTVETGLDDNRMIRIVSGLAEGDQVLLNPPMEDSAKPRERDTALAGVPPKPAPVPPATRKPAQPTTDVSAQAPPQPGQAPVVAAPGGEGAPGGGEGRRGNATPEQQAQFLAMIPQEHREKVKAMTPEQQKEWFTSSEDGKKVMQQLRSQFGGPGRRGPGGEGQGQTPPPQPSAPAAGS